MSGDRIMFNYEFFSQRVQITRILNERKEV